MRCLCKLMARERTALQRPWKQKQVAYVCAREVGTSREKVWCESVTGAEKSLCVYQTRKGMSPVHRWMLNENLVEDFDYVILQVGISEMVHRKNLQIVDVVWVQRLFLQALDLSSTFKASLNNTHRAGLVWLLLEGELLSSAAMPASFDTATGCYVISP